MFRFLPFMDVALARPDASSSLFGRMIDLTSFIAVFQYFFEPPAERVQLRV
jgi:hypothetical protein